jgi:hypothetical protein
MEATIRVNCSSFKYCSNYRIHMVQTEKVALLDEEEAKEFYEYATKESTPEEKQQLKEDLEFYKSHCMKQVQ